MSRLLIIICTTPRTGSTLLCQLMKACGGMGFPKEYLAPLYRKKFCSQWHVDIDDVDKYLTEISRRAPDGVVSLKLFYDNFENMVNGSLGFGSNPLAALLAKIPSEKVVLISLQRRDKIAQAISHIKAMQSNQWFKSSSSVAGGLSLSDKPVQFRRDLIDEQLMTIAREEARWQKMFAAINKRPDCELYYEDFIFHPVKALEKIIAACGLNIIGVDNSIDAYMASKNALMKQGDQVSDEWWQKYVNEWTPPKTWIEFHRQVFGESEFSDERT